MADIINLRQARKRKARQKAADTAEENRRSFGRTKAEKTLTHAVNVMEKNRLETHKRETGSETETAEPVGRET